MYNYVTLIVDFQRWWVLTRKIFGLNSIFRKIWMILEIENSFWKSDFRTFWRTVNHFIHKIRWFPLIVLLFRTYHFWNSIADLTFVYKTKVKRAQLNEFRTGATGGVVQWIEKTTTFIFVLKIQWSTDIFQYLMKDATFSNYAQLFCLSLTRIM